MSRAMSANEGKFWLWVVQKRGQARRLRALPKSGGNRGSEVTPPGFYRGVVWQKFSSCFSHGWRTIIS